MKKEKYISQKIRKTTTSWVVKIPYYIGNERRTYERAFSEADFGSSARQMAIYHRNDKLAEFQRGNVPQTAPTVRDCFKRSLVLFPRRPKTQKQHDYFLRHGIGDLADPGLGRAAVPEPVRRDTHPRHDREAAVRMASDLQGGCPG